MSAESADAPVIRRMPWDLELLTVVFTGMSFLGALNGPFLSQRIDEDLRTAAKMGATFALVNVLGAVLLSRVSDKLPRRGVLWVGFAGNLASNCVAVGLPRYWTPLIVGGFFMVGTISTVSALFGDYCISMKASGEEIATWQSRMALAVTIPRIVAPLLGPMLATNFDESMRLVTVGTLLITPAVLFLHPPRERKERQKMPSISELLNVRTARTPAALWYYGWCFLGVFLFNVCATLLGPLFTERFGMDAGLRGQIQSAAATGSVIGYLFSGPVKQRFGTPHPTRLISGFLFFTFVGRAGMFLSANFAVHLTANFLFGFVGIGIIGPIKDSMPLLFVPTDELGGFTGIQRAVESFSGVLGPAFAGLIGGSLGYNLLTLLCVAFYLTVPLYAYIGYPRYMQPAVEHAQAERAKAD